MYNRKNIEMIKERYPKVTMTSVTLDPNHAILFVNIRKTPRNYLYNYPCILSRYVLCGHAPGEDSFHIIHDEIQTEELSEEPEMNMSM